MVRLRRLGRLAGTLFVALLLMVAAIGVIAESEWFKNWLRLKLVNQLATVLDGELRVGRLGGTLWTGVTLDDLELTNRDGQVLHADRIRVRYDPITLAKRRWIVDRVVIEHASIRIAETASGWNVAHLTRPRPPGGKPPTVFIRSLELVDSTVAVDRTSAEPRILTGVNLTSSLKASGGAVSFDIQALNALDAATGLAVHEFQGSASDNFRNFEVRFTAGAEHMAIGGTARGHMDGTTRIVDADFDTTRLNLAPLFERPNLASDITGHVNSRAVLPADGRPWQIAFRFSGRGSRALGYAADRIEASGRVASGAVIFDSNVSAYGAQATVHGTWRWAMPGRAAAFNGHGTFASLDVRKLPSTLKLPQLDTRVSGRFEATASERHWTAHGILSGGVVEGAAVGPNTHAAIDSNNGVTTYAAVGVASHVDVERFGRVLSVASLSTPRFSSDLTGDFFVVGRTSADTPHFLIGGAALSDSTVSGTRVSHLNALASLEDRRLVVTASGTFEELNQTTLALAWDSFKAAGQVDGWLAIDDIDQPITEHNLEFGGRADLGPSILRGVNIESLAANGRLLGGALTLDTLDVRTADATVTAAGSLGLSEPAGGAGITLKADIRDRAFLERLLQRPVFAAGSVDAVVTGTLASPSASGSLALHEVAYDDTLTALTTNATFTVEWPDRVVDRLAWKVKGDASFVTIEGTEIQQVTASADGGPKEMAVDVLAEQKSRTIGIEGQLRLQPEARELLLRRLALTTGAIEWSLPPDQQAVFRYGVDRIEVRDLTLVRGTQQIRVAGGFDVGTGPQTGGGSPLQLKLTEVDVADVNNILLGDRQLTGRINGTVTVRGNRAAPIVDGDITIAKGTVQGVAYESVQGRVNYAEGIATIDATLNQSPGASVKATGTIPVNTSADAGRSMDLRITGGPVNLGLVQAFTAEIDKVSGDASIDLRVTGSIADPMLAGHAGVTNGAFTVLGTGVRYQTVEAALDFADGRMKVRQLRLADVTGDELTATGELDIRRGVTNRAVDVSVRARSVSVLANQFGTAAMDADLRVSGDLSAPVLRGTATLESGRIEVANLLEQTAARPYSTTPQEAPGTEQPAARVLTPWEKADINVQVHLPDNLVLRGRNLRVSGSGFGLGDMNIITGGTFDVTKSPGAEVGVRGTLEVVQGSYTFQGRRFEIERGSDVRFPGGRPLTDPIVNVDATRDISGVIAQVHLRGSARTPELTLSSRPALEESDILSLIVFNQPVSALGSAEQVNLGQRAAAMAAGAIASPLADSIGRALNLDVFEIQAPTDDTAGAVVIGSQLSSRILLGLRQQFGNSEAGMVTLEYRVNRLLRFVTSVASGTLQAHATRRTDRGGVDLIFVIRY